MRSRRTVSEQRGGRADRDGRRDGEERRREDFLGQGK